MEIIDEQGGLNSRAVPNAPSGICIFNKPLHESMHYPPAWVCLAVGQLDDAYSLSSKNNDVICLVASLVMQGDTEKALKIVEALVISACVVVHERLKGEESNDFSSLKRMSEILLACIRGRGQYTSTLGTSVDATCEEYQKAAMGACEIVDWDVIHRWFIIALLLHEGEYKAPDVAWFHCFFALPHTKLRERAASPEFNANKRSSEVASPITLLSDDTTGPQLKNTLLSRCGEDEMLLISTICSWKTRRYRSAISSATHFLSLVSGDQDILDDYMGIMVRFILCMSLISIGERTAASKEVAILMRHKEPFVVMVGCSIASFLLPLPECLGRITSFNGPISRRRYLIALCEYVHALTLLQLGCMEAAIDVIREALQYASSHGVGDWLLDILCIACTAIENSKMISEWPVSLHRQLYLALAPAFFGGFHQHELRFNPKSAMGRLLSPKRFPLCASVRQMLPVYMLRANQKFSKGDYFEAWENVVLAVGCAEEIIGSVEFAFTDCSPVLVYAFGCRVGERVIGTLMATMTSGDLTTGTNSAEASAFAQKGDALGESVIQLCQQWARRIREFHPNVRLGAFTLSKCATFSHTKNFLSRAMDVARRYPRSALAQNCLTLALYDNHNIPEAADSAANALQTFPHTVEVKALYNYMLKKDGLYYYTYRGLIPILCSSCNDYKWTKRSIVTILLLAVNVVIILATLVLNLPNVFTLSEGAKEIALRVQLPSLIPISYTLVVFTYAITASVTADNLTRTILQDLFFDNGPLNRFIFAMRGIAFMNATNALLITFAGNNFLFTSHWYTFLFYLLFFIAFVPFTSHLWLLPSSDQPKEALWTWLALVSVDVAAAAFLLVPHVILFVIEPVMFAMYFLVKTAHRPSQDAVSGNVKKRLVLHSVYRDVMPPRYAVTTGSQFVHLALLKLLFYKSHSTLSTKYLIPAQMEEENYRVFPLIEIFEPISLTPMEIDKETKYTLTSAQCPGTSLKASQRDNVAGGGGRDPEFDGFDDEDDDDLEWGYQSPLARSFAGGNMSGVHATEDQVVDEEAMSSFLTMGVTLLTEFGKRSGKRKSTTAVSDASVELNELRLQRKDSMHGGELRNRKQSVLFRHGFSSPRSRSGCTGGRPTRSKLERTTSFVFGDSRAGSFRFDEKGGRGGADKANRSFGANNSTTDRVGEPPLQKKASFINLDPAFGERVEGSSPSVVSSRASSISPAEAIDEKVSQNPPTAAKEEASREAKSKVNISAVPTEELELTESLKRLCDLCRSMTSRKLKAADKRRLEEAKAGVQHALASLGRGAGSETVCLTSESCCEVVCDTLYHLIAVDNWKNPLEGGESPLAETLLQRVEVSCLAKMMAAKDIPLQCVLHGKTNILSMIMTPSCVKAMCFERWRATLEALQNDAKCKRDELLLLLYKGLESTKGKKLLEALRPVVQTTVRFVLMAESSHMTTEKLFALLETIKGEKRIPVDFSEEEDSLNRTLFSHACASGNVGLIEVLWCLELVKSPNRIQSDGTNALMQAVMNNQRRVVQWFCDHAIDSTDKSFQHVHPVYGDALNIAKEVDGDLHALMLAKVEELKTFQWASSAEER